MTLGPLMIDLEGPELTPAERRLLGEPAVGGVILFTRNYSAPDQLRELTAQIHALRDPPLLIAVDQEGGRVQRFREGFTPLPPARALGQAYAADRRRGLQLAGLAGWLMAAELLEAGVDLSFAPVLDLDHSASTVIGDRAYHRSPDAVSELASACMRGMQEAGMAAVGKHFPGHGGVTEDSHVALPADHRSLHDLREDLLPFERLVRNGLPALMTAHVVYTAVDELPASLSARWIGDWLRRRMRFEGVVFSDDLSMEGAAVAGDKLERARLALAAGSDLLLLCNDREAAQAAVMALRGQSDPVGQVRRLRLHGRHKRVEGLRAGARWQEAAAALSALSATQSDFGFET